MFGSFGICIETMEYMERSTGKSVTSHTIYIQYRKSSVQCIYVYILGLMEMDVSFLVGGLYM